ncbi:MAG: T9SS type A sorting domain-containing protein, partial [Sediminibacterium sp.]
PGGANPGADYWQVRMSNNNGSTWTYVENTKTSEMRWRRNAFHVSDYMTPTAQMKLQFIASDSLRPTVNLNGGSLVEGALDDFIVYEEVVIGVDENKLNVFNATAFPNPTTESARIQFQLSKPEFIEVLVLDAVGRTIYSIPAHEYGTQLQNLIIPCEKWAKGSYQVALRNNRKSISTIQIIKD